jgi:hypothetical protein
LERDAIFPFLKVNKTVQESKFWKSFEPRWELTLDQVESMLLCLLLKTETENRKKVGLPRGLRAWALTAVGHFFLLHKYVSEFHNKMV